MATIAMPHFGFVGHVGPTVRLGRVLARQGHRVLAWGADAFRAEIEATGAEFTLHDPFPLREHVSSPQAMSAAIAEETERHLGELVERLLAEEVDLVVHDLHALWGRVAADFLGLPRLVSHPVFPGAARLLQPFDPLSPEIAADAVRVMQLRAAVWRVGTARQAILDRWGIDVGPWQDALVSQGDCTVNYSTPELTGIEQPGPGWRYLGPLTEEPPAREERHGPVRVLLSFGTVFNFRPEPFRAALDALAQDPCEVLLTLGGGPLRPEEIGRLAPNVKVRGYIDSAAELARTDVFVTHAGTSSVHESLAAGVPMVCLPRGADQHAWAERVVAVGAGTIAELEPASIAAAVREVLADESFAARARGVGDRLQAFDGDAAVADVVGGLLAESRPPGARA